MFAKKPLPLSGRKTRLDVDTDVRGVAASGSGALKYLGCVAKPSASAFASLRLRVKTYPHAKAQRRKEKRADVSQRVFK
jgi:hypothetical protein